MTLFGVAWLIGAIPAVARSWQTAPKYYNLARLLLPIVIVTAFSARLLIPGFPGTNMWVWWLLVFLLFYISGAVLYYLYNEPGDYTPRPIITRSGELQLRTANGQVLPMIDHRLDETVTIRMALPEDLSGVGQIFAEVFGHTFDLSFGADRERNAKLIADLLTLKTNEVLVAVEGRNRVVGAMWLDLADSRTGAANPRTIYPITRKYLDGWSALYFAVLGVPGMMAVRGTSDMGYVQWLGVAPEWQGHHVARKLMNRAEQFAFLNGKTKLGLHTERFNRPARALYKHLGFVENGIFKIAPRVYYVKQLKNRSLNKSAELN